MKLDDNGQNRSHSGQPRLDDDSQFLMHCLQTEWPQVGSIRGCSESSVAEKGRVQRGQFIKYNLLSDVEIQC